MSETKGTRGDRTRAAVLAAACTRFATEGYGGTTGARIAADAGVSEATIAFHFGSKAGLLVAVMQAWYDDLLARIDELVVSEDAPVDRMRRFLGWWLRHSDANHELLSVFAREGRQADHGEVVEAFRDCNRRVTRVVEHMIEDLKHSGAVRTAVPTRMLRDAFFGTTEHLLARRALTGRPADLDAAAEDVWGLLMHGASTGDAPVSLPRRLQSIEAKVDRLLEQAAGGDVPDPPGEG